MLKLAIIITNRIFTKEERRIYPYGIRWIAFLIKGMEVIQLVTEKSDQIF